MTTFVLVGGAWIGGWVWRDVTRDLRQRGHDVYPATLTGLGDRVHLGRPETDLETHVTDVINLIDFEDLHDVALVGHSYAGGVIESVADRIGERLSHTIYVDTAPLENGESNVDFVISIGGDPDELQRQVDAEGDGWRYPAVPFADAAMDEQLTGVSDADRQRLAAKSVAQPWRTYTQKVRLNGTGEGPFQRVIVACNEFRELAGSGLPRFAQFAPPAWRIEHLQTGHWPMLSQPAELAATLDRIVSED